MKQLKTDSTDAPIDTNYDVEREYYTEGCFEPAMAIILILIILLW